MLSRRDIGREIRQLQDQGGAGPENEIILRLQDELANLTEADAFDGAVSVRGETR